ncbi:hypothetical protein BU24DRAFT_353048 [Aaosphaeria arxii CBS 175.79]|uniref:BRCT domain-containing protein n=1 Tax=Aaosphaeria arxii CBS 175.79 TaxID=1450172 RepID=A0A6A5XH45_9PLEO|nr:uncharacterized protein BU24DRAFT_353048 [Aaosphaeria arxii CBS 175.79]KAF2012166.1 hypothetical protein BU24DRAFT_353048 [Aaosphaeria arxii CBS 175.79]
MQQPPAKPTTKASLPKPCTTTTATIKTAAPPTRTFFDPWNSSSTGHQRAENRLSGSTSWRDCRNRKLGEQFRSSGRGGGRRVADTVGAGSEGFGIDGRLANGGWERGASGLRTGGQRSLVEVWGARKRRCSSSQEGESHTLDINDKDIVLPPPDHHHLPSSTSTSPPAQRPPSPSSPAQPKQIFSGLCMYINGSTAPLISDQNLKRLLATRGATTSVALGRRTVTHVVLGTPISHRGSGSGSGGGLAASKIQREIERTGGKGVRFVSVEWVLESVKADIRLPESRFASSTLRLAPEGQNSVYGMFTSKAAR